MVTHNIYKILFDKVLGANFAINKLMLKQLCQWTTKI